VQPDPIEEPPGAPSLFPDWSFAVFGLLAAVLFSGIFGTAAIAVFGAERDIRTAVAGQFGLWVGMVGAALVYAKRSGMTLRTRTDLLMVPRDFAWIALGPVLQVLFGLAYRPFVSTDKVEQAAQDVADLARGQLGPYLLLCFTTAICAPLVEELFFRGVVMRGPTSGVAPTLARRSQQVTAVVVSAVVFGAIHLQPLLFPALAAFGAVCALLVIRFNRLGPAIWLHIGFNTSTMVAMGLQIF
jgi:uncharacterized protein